MFCTRQGHHAAIPLVVCILVVLPASSGSYDYRSLVAFTAACRLWWRLPTSRTGRGWSGGSWPAASRAAGHKSEQGWIDLCCLVNPAAAACPCCYLLLPGAPPSCRQPSLPEVRPCLMRAMLAIQLPSWQPASPRCPLCRWRTELVSPLLRSDYASGAAGGVAGGSPVGQPLLEWTGSAPTAQQLDRPSSGPMPTPGQQAAAQTDGWLAPAASVPHAIDGRLAGVVEAGERVPSPPAAPVRRGIIGSLPDFLGALRHEPQHLHHLQRHHPRWAACAGLAQGCMLTPPCNICTNPVCTCTPEAKSAISPPFPYSCPIPAGTCRRWQPSSHAWHTTTSCTCLLASTASEPWPRWHRCVRSACVMGLAGDGACCLDLLQQRLAWLLRSLRCMCYCSFCCRLPSPCTPQPLPHVTHMLLAPPSALPPCSPSRFTGPLATTSFQMWMKRAAATTAGMNQRGRMLCSRPRACHGMGSTRRRGTVASWSRRCRRRMCTASSSSISSMMRSGGMASCTNRLWHLSMLQPWVPLAQHRSRRQVQRRRTQRHRR